MIRGRGYIPGRDVRIGFQNHLASYPVNGRKREIERGGKTLGKKDMWKGRKEMKNGKKGYKERMIRKYGKKKEESK